MNTGPYPTGWCRSLRWRDHQVSFIVTGEPRPDRAPVVLIHGFGACKEHWRHNAAALARGRQTYAIDLLGFGSSSKPSSWLDGEPFVPGSIRYGMDLWAEQVVDFLNDQGVGPVQLVGNSIGGVVALACARRLEQLGRPARQVVLIDCAQRALDDKRLASQPLLARWVRPLLKSVVRQRWITGPLFRSLASPGMIRKVLAVAYPSGQNIDDQLVDLLLQPARDPQAPEAFRGFINLFDDRLAPDLLADLSTPVRLIWGEDDPWEPVAEARRWLSFTSVKDIAVISGLGHCPHDEDPERINTILEALLEEGDRYPDIHS